MTHRTHTLKMNLTPIDYYIIENPPKTSYKEGKRCNYVIKKGLKEGKVCNAKIDDCSDFDKCCKHLKI